MRYFRVSLMLLAPIALAACSGEAEKVEPEQAEATPTSEPVEEPVSGDWGAEGDDASYVDEPQGDSGPSEIIEQEESFDMPEAIDDLDELAPPPRVVEDDGDVY